MMEYEWKPSVETVIRCISTFRLLFYGSMAPPPLGLAQKGQCSPLYLLNQKESTRNIAWLSNWGYAEVVPHQCSVRDQMLFEIKVAKSRKLAPPHYVLKSKSDKNWEKKNSGESNGSLRLMFCTDPNSFFVDWVADFWCYFDISFIINIFTNISLKDGGSTAT